MDNIGAAIIILLGILVCLVCLSVAIRNIQTSLDKILKLLSKAEVAEQHAYAAAMADIRALGKEKPNG